MHAAPECGAVHQVRCCGLLPRRVRPLLSLESRRHEQGRTPPAGCDIDCVAEAKGGAATVDLGRNRGP